MFPFIMIAQVFQGTNDWNNKENRLKFYIIKAIQRNYFPHEHSGVNITNRHSVEGLVMWISNKPSLLYETTK